PCATDRERDLQHHCHAESDRSIDFADRAKRAGRVAGCGLWLCAGNRRGRNRGSERHAGRRPPCGGDLSRSKRGPAQRNFCAPRHKDIKSLSGSFLTPWLSSQRQGLVPRNRRPDNVTVIKHLFPRTPVTDLALSTVNPALLEQATRLLLAPAALEFRQLSQVLANIHVHHIDFADLYFQYSRLESWSLEEGIVKSGSFSIDRGVGVRAVSGDKTAFAYSDDISLDALNQAASATRAIGRQGQSAVAALDKIGAARALYAPSDPVVALADADKVALLERLERLARAQDPRVTQVMA